MKEKEFLLGTIKRLETEEEIDSLLEIITNNRVKTLLELGSYQSHTTCYMSDVVEDIFSWKEHDKNKPNTFFSDNLNKNSVINVSYFEFLQLDDILIHNDVDCIYIDYLLTEDWTTQLQKVLSNFESTKIIHKIDQYELLVDSLKKTHNVEFENDYFIVLKKEKEQTEKKEIKKATRRSKKSDSS